MRAGCPQRAAGTRLDSVRARQSRRCATLRADSCRRRLGDRYVAPGSYSESLRLPPRLPRADVRLYTSAAASTRSTPVLTPLRSIAASSLGSERRSYARPGFVGYRRVSRALAGLRHRPHNPSRRPRFSVIRSLERVEYFWQEVEGT